MLVPFRPPFSIAAGDMIAFSLTQHLPAGAGFTGRGQQQKFLPPPVPYHETLAHSVSVVPGFSDIPLGHHDLESQDGSYNRLSYQDDADDNGPSYSRLGRVSQRPRVPSPQRVRSTKVQSTSNIGDYSSLHPTPANRSSSHEEFDIVGGIYSDVSDDAPYNRLGVNPSTTTEGNYSEVKNTSPNLKARGARPGSYNALRGVEVGVVDHSQNTPLYSFPETVDSDEGQYSQLQNTTTQVHPAPASSEKHSTSNVAGGGPEMFDSHGSVILDPVTQHYEVSPAASPTARTKFEHPSREESYEPEDSSEDFYYELAHKGENRTMATSPAGDNFDGLYSCLNNVTITGAPRPASDKVVQDAMHNPNMHQPAKASRPVVASGPPVPPRRSTNPNHMPMHPSQPYPSKFPTTSSAQSPTDGASNMPFPPTAPKPKPRK